MVRRRLEALINHKFSPIAFFVICKLVFDWSYTFFNAPLYAFMGFGYNPSLGNWTLSFLVSVATFALVYSRKKTLSSLAINTFLIIAYLPLSSFFAISGRDPRYFLYVSFCWILVKLVIDAPWGKIISAMKPSQTIIERVKHLHQKHGKLIGKFSNISIYVACGLVSVAAIFGFIIYTDPSSWVVALNVERIYEIRQDLEFPTWFSYISVWQMQVVNPFLAAYFIYRKKYPLVTIPFIFQVLIYLSTGTRVALLAIPLFVTFWIVAKLKHSFIIFSALASLGVAASSVLLIFTRVGLVVYSVLVMRLLYLPAFIEYEYFYFFQNAPHLFFSEGRIGQLFGIISPYPMESVRLVAMHISGTATSLANTGFLADGFANMGVAGMMVVSLVLAVILKYCDSFLNKLPLSLVTACIIVPLFSIVNISLLTTILTGGLALMMLLLSLLALANASENRGLQNE